MVSWRKRSGGGDDATELSARGGWLIDQGELAEAESVIRRALDLDPTLAASWFDLGLLHKWRREWAASLDCNRRSVELSGNEGEPAYWNAGIAATALRDWSSARWAWRGFGVPIDAGDDEIIENFGLGAIRLPDGEVVWGRRIDPARMRTVSIPLPGQGFRCGDLLLHDGEPQGSRVVQGREYSVFNLIELFEPGPDPTTELLLDASRDEIDALITALETDAAAMVENWTDSITMHCSACAHGRVDYDDPDHDHPQPEWAGYTRLGVCGPPEAIRTVTERWASTSAAVLQRLTVHD